MYPSKEFPSFGVFVKNTEAILTDEGFIVHKAVIKKSVKKSKKATSYLSHYFNVVWKGLIGNYEAVYVHYAAHNAFPLLLLKKLKPSVRIVTNVHGSDVVPEVASQEKFQPYVKKLLQKSTLVITPSNYYKQLVQEKYNITTPIEIFPSGGVNSAVFYPNSQERENQLKQLKLDPTRKYFGYVGRMDVGKGWDHLLKGFSAFLERNPFEKNTTRLIMVGSGKDDKAFFQMRSELGLNDYVIHYPLMKHQDLAVIYNIIELFIFPTTRKGESLGLVGLEAMACKTPILASRIGGILDYVEDGANSWLFKVGDWEDLVKQLELYNRLTMEEKQQIANAAYDTAQNYDQRKIQSKLSSIFHELELTK